jgi:hypothetical protein
VSARENGSVTPLESAVTEKRVGTRYHTHSPEWISLRAPA